MSDSLGSGGSAGPTSPEGSAGSGGSDGAGSAPPAGSERTVVYTDGACRGNPGPGGWAWVVPAGPWACGFAAETTNQRMELQAVLEALSALGGPVEVVSDSTYVVNCFRDGWYRSWLRKGWRNAAGKPVANRDLWEPLVGLYLDRPDEIKLRWVKGHGGDQWNEMADKLAVEAALTRQSSSSPTPSAGSIRIANPRV